MRIFESKYKIDNEIAKLQEEFFTIQETKEVVKSPWWVKTRGVLIDKMIVLDKEIVSLSVDVIRNADAIRGKYSLRTAIKGLLNVIETTLKAEEEITKKLKQLKEVAERAELMR